MEWLNLLAGFPGFDIQVRDLFIVCSVPATTNSILKRIHRNLVAATRSQSPQLLAAGVQVPQAAVPLQLLVLRPPCT